MLFYINLFHSILLLSFFRSIYSIYYLIYTYILSFIVADADDDGGDDDDDDDDDDGADADDDGDGDDDDDDDGDGDDDDDDDFPSFFERLPSLVFWYLRSFAMRQVGCHRTWHLGET